MTTRAYLDYWAELTWRVRAQLLLIFALVSLLLVSVGPFNTFDEPPLLRFSYWFLTQTLFGLLVMPVMARIVRLSSFAVSLPLSLGIVLLVLVVTVPTAALVYAGDMTALRSVQSAGIIVAPEDLSPWQRAISASSILLLYWSVLAISIVSIGFSSIPFFMDQRRAGSSLPISPGAQFLSRLPDHLGSTLLCLQMEDHYLRVTTEQGEALILLRFRDALNELADYPGLQVHRSWWVASRAIARLSRSGRKTEVILNNGQRVPVSASFRDGIDALLNLRAKPD